MNRSPYRFFNPRDRKRGGSQTPTGRTWKATGGLKASEQAAATGPLQMENDGLRLPPSHRSRLSLPSWR